MQSDHYFSQEDIYEAFKLIFFPATKFMEVCTMSHLELHAEPDVVATVSIGVD